MDGAASSVAPGAAHPALSWDALLPILAEAPRENGTAALALAAEQLEAALRAAGLEPVLIPFAAHPYALRLAGVVALAGAVLYGRLLRGGRAALALLVAVAIPAAILLDLERGWPVFSWLHTWPQHHVSATVPAAGEPVQRLLVTAHYDTKTDLLDHVARAPVEAASAPVTLLMVLAAVLAWLGPRRRRGAERARRALVAATPWLALASGLAFFATLSAGAFLPERSPGALDDGGACAVAARLAERIARAPLARTELEVLLLSGEEVGTQGALVLARERFAVPPALPTAVVNLEILGAAPDLAALATERFTLRSFRADPRLVALADEVHRERRGTPLHLLGGGVTDARAFLARGVAALTLVSDAPGHPPARGLHSAADDRSRLDTAALEEHLAFLEDLARRIDRIGP